MTDQTNQPGGQTMDPDDDGDTEAPPATAAPRRSARTRPAVRDAEAARPSVRGDGSVIGRDGEILARKRTSTADIFYIPPDLIPKGWDYQWCAVTVTGNSEILMDQNLMMAENGWRPVPADRHNGRFMPAGHKGHIIRGGQLLMERPTALGDQARAEDVAKARRQMTDRDQALLGGKASVRNAMRDGIEMGGKYRGTGGDVRVTVDRAIDIPAPQHTLAEPGE